MTDKRSVFVVHGRNGTLRDAMFNFLRSLDLNPMEWTRAIELTGVGSPYIGQVLDAAFEHASAVVVLMTPDEVAYLRPEIADGHDDPETQPATQARPNVLFEAGMALGRDPVRTILVEVGDLRPFSDVAGRHAVRLTNDVKKRQDLANRLRTAGCDIQLSGTDWQTTGDFTPPSPPGGGLALGRRVPSRPVSRPVVDFDVRYADKGSSRLAKLAVINRGVGDAYNVKLDFPESAALNHHRETEIKKIPGGGKSVTIDVENKNHYMGGPMTESAFEVTITAQTETGESIVQTVFVDVNG